MVQGNKLLILTIFFITLSSIYNAEFYQRIWHIRENYNMYPQYTYHDMCHTYYYSYDVSGVPDVTDTDEFTVKLSRSYNDIVVADLTPRWEDIRFYKYRHYFINKSGEHFKGEHYVAWDITKTCGNNERYKICYKIRFFPCREDAEVFYSTLENTNKLRHNTVEFDLYDRFALSTVSSNEFNYNGSVDNLEADFKRTSAEAVCTVA